MARQIAEFRPKIPESEWAVIEAFVRAAVEEAAPRTAYTTKDLLVGCTLHVHWCWKVAGLPLEREVLFRPLVIEEAVLNTCSHLAKGTQGNRRSAIYAVARALLGPEVVPTRLRPLPKSDPSVPYTAPELDRIRNWADEQVSAYRRLHANIMVACGAGAGLSALELQTLLVKDVEIDDQGVMLHVRGKRARVVPVLYDWEKRFGEFVEAVGDPDAYFFRPGRTNTSRNVIGNFVDTCNGPAPRITLQRLRATWIVRHLAAATPVTALLEASGIESLESLTRYVRFVPGLETPDLRAALRGERS